MATARAQGGLKGECLEPCESKESHSLGDGVCTVMAHTNTTSYQGWQGRPLVRSSKKVKIRPLGIVSHTVWSMQNEPISPGLLGLVSVWTCFPPHIACPHDYDSR